MLDRSLLARVDVGFRACLEQKRRHVFRKERPCLRIHHVKTVMVDEHRLLLQPLRPAISADALDDAASDLARKWRTLKTLAGLTAPNTRNSCGHFELRPGVLYAGEPEEREETEINPSDVELIPLRLEFRGVRIVMMVVVQLLSAQPDRNW